MVQHVPDIDWSRHTISGTNYQQRVSQTFLDITMDLGLEQLVNFPTRQQNTLDLIFTTHPSYKIRCKPLPPTSHKSVHGIVLLDTAHQPQRSRLPRRRIYLWKRADVEGIQEHFKQFSQFFLSENFDSIEVMWISFKTSNSSAVDTYVPSKMSSTRQTDP